MQWLFYLIRVLFYRFSGALYFFGKPGSRLIIPSLFALSAFLFRPGWHGLITDRLRTADPGLEPETAVLDVVLVILTLLFWLAYYIGSKLFALVLGAFPMAQRPLPPQKKLAAMKPKTEEASAVVRIVVPPLPKRRK